MDVLTVHCADTRDALELRASEAALRARVSELESALEGHELQARVRALEEGERAARAKAAAAAAEMDSARRECSTALQRAKDLEVQLAQARAECALYISEIEVRAAGCRRWRGPAQPLPRLLAMLAFVPLALVHASTGCHAHCRPPPPRTRRCKSKTRGCLASSRRRTRPTTRY